MSKVRGLHNFMDKVFRYRSSQKPIMKYWQKRIPLRELSFVQKRIPSFTVNGMSDNEYPVMVWNRERSCWEPKEWESCSRIRVYYSINILYDELGTTTLTNSSDKVVYIRVG